MDAKLWTNLLNKNNVGACQPGINQIVMRSAKRLAYELEHLMDWGTAKRSVAAYRPAWFAYAYLTAGGGWPGAPKQHPMRSKARPADEEQSKTRR